MRSPVLVCGLGRCGSSLVMQMLQAGGHECFGEFPSFEPDEVGHDRNLTALLPKLEGKAAKILDPHLSKWPDLPNIRVIWLDRDKTEQAKSQVKSVRLISGIDISGQAWRPMRKSLICETARCLGLFHDLGVLPLRLKFEDVLARPPLAAEAIREHVHFPLNVSAMQRAVIARSAKCAPSLEIETRLCGFTGVAS